MGLSNKRCVQFRGSETVKALVQGACDLYGTEHPDQSLVITGGGTERGYKSVLDGTTHFGMVASEMSAELEQWSKRIGAHVTSTTLGFDGVLAYVNAANPLDSLTIENLHDVYTGTITNWSDLGGIDAPIVPMSQYPSTGSYSVWRKVVVGDGGNFAARVKPLEGKALFKEVVKTPAAIGFGSATFVNGAIKPLKIEGFALSPENIKSGEYKLRRPLMLVGDSTLEPVAQTFLAWLLDPQKGQKLIERLGVVPVR